MQGIPRDWRAGKPGTDPSSEDITKDKLTKVRRLNEIAQKRGQSMAQMALAWVLRKPAVTSALKIGASRVSQIEDGVAALDKFEFSGEELEDIEKILVG